jgi:hypothetical protein
MILTDCEGESEKVCKEGFCEIDLEAGRRTRERERRRNKK